jgi:hypothetical protein
MRVYVVRKWPLRGRSRFVCWNITRVSLWLLCNVRFVQSTQRTHLRDLADLKAWIIAAVKNIDASMLTRVWQELEYRVVVCRVTRGALVFLLYIYVCNHGEYYETPFSTNTEVQSRPRTYFTQPVPLSFDTIHSSLQIYAFWNKSKRIPSIFKDESTRSCICLWKLAVAVATYVSICIV